MGRVKGRSGVASESVASVVAERLIFLAEIFRRAIARNADFGGSRCQYGGRVTATRG
jgi:hypothetical protein